MKKIIIAISFLAFMVSCSSGGEQQPTDPDMDPTVAQDDSVYKEESGDASEETASAGGKVVVSPLVGTFYVAPAEDAEPFVKVGDAVKKGQTLAIVEAMKLMNEIESDFDGVIEEVLVSNGHPVEYNQPLFRLK